MDKEILTALIRIIITFPLVAAMAYFFIKYGLARRMLSNDGRRRMRVIEQIPLSPKASISLVEVGGKYLLISHSENNTCLIKEMNELPEPLVQVGQEKVNWAEMADKARSFLNIPSVKNRK